MTTEQALENCYMLARLRLRKCQPTELDAWKHIIRFCESAGCKSSVLRELDERIAPSLEKKP